VGELNGGWRLIMGAIDHERAVLASPGAVEGAFGDWHASGDAPALDLAAVAPNGPGDEDNIINEEGIPYSRTIDKTKTAWQCTKKRCTIHNIFYLFFKDAWLKGCFRGDSERCCLCE